MSAHVTRESSISLSTATTAETAGASEVGSLPGFHPDLPQVHLIVGP